jgi:hypothetical protein
MELLPYYKKIKTRHHNLECMANEQVQKHYQRRLETCVRRPERLCSISVNLW